MCVCVCKCEEDTIQCISDEITQARTALLFHMQLRQDLKTLFQGDMNSLLLSLVIFAL